MNDGKGYDASGLKAAFGMVITRTRSWIDIQLMLQSVVPGGLESFNQAVDQLFEQVGDADKDERLRILLRRMVYDTALHHRICPVCHAEEMESLGSAKNGSEMLWCRGCEDEFVAPCAKTESVSAQ